MFVFKEANKLFFSFELGCSQRKNTTPCFISKNINFKFRTESLKLFNILQVHWELDPIKIQSFCLLPQNFRDAIWVSFNFPFCGIQSSCDAPFEALVNRFFMLMSAFLLARNFGSGTQELPFNGSYPTV